MSIAYKKNGVWVIASGTPPIDDALSTTSENAVQNKVVKTTTDKVQQMIAPILSSLVAPSGGLASGEQFIYNGLLYKATAAIAQDGTITINGNCELADNVTGQIDIINAAITVLNRYFSSKYLTSSNNLNDISDNFGIYYWRGGGMPANTPSGGSYAVMLHIGGTTYGTFQLICSSVSGKMFYRYIDDNLQWSSWKTITAT